MSKKTHGFTLVELLTIVTVIGVLSGFAMTAYSNYVTDAQISTVSSHFEDAGRFVRNEYASSNAEVAMGVDDPPPVPNDAAGWIALIGKNKETAPGGGPTYVPGVGDPSTGAIGVQVAGTFAAGDSVVTLTQPAFKGLTQRSVVINQN